MDKNKLDKKKPLSKSQLLPENNDKVQNKVISKSVIKGNSINNNEEILKKAFSKNYEKYLECHISQKPAGLVKSFASNSYKGLVKPNNEDRVIVVSPIPKPQKTIRRTWPKMSYFAVFDGHGGENCSEFLKNNFLNYLIDNKNYPFDIKLALKETFEKMEEEIYNQNKGKGLNEIDKSGSCALVCVISENKIYIANIGDSRAIMSVNNGNKVKELTIDHKPNNIKEYERIIKNGGKVYVDDDYQEDGLGKYNEDELNYIVNKDDFQKYKGQKEIIFRHFPSDLAITRSIGDLKIKKKEYGGLPGNIIGIPEIFIYDYSQENDFIIMGCDGIYDDLSNEDIINAAWYIFKNKMKERKYDINLLSKECCDLIIKYAMELLTSDNLSCIVIGLDGIHKYLSLKKIKDKNK